jgi:hypothetical protein
VKSVVASVGPNNFSACKQKLLDVIVRCREIGFAIPTDEESNLLANLKAEFEREVRAAFEREEQARIKAQIREEEKIKRDAERERQQAEKEAQAIQAALDQALAAANGSQLFLTDHIQRHMCRHDSGDRVGFSLRDQHRFNIKIAGEQSAHDQIAFGNEPAAKAGQFAILQIAVGREACVFERINLLQHE